MTEILRPQGAAAADGGGSESSERVREVLVVPVVEAQRIDLPGWTSNGMQRAAKTFAAAERFPAHGTRNCSAEVVEFHDSDLSSRESSPSEEEKFLRAAQRIF